MELARKSVLIWHWKLSFPKYQLGKTIIRLVCHQDNWCKLHCRPTCTCSLHQTWLDSTHRAQYRQYTTLVGKKVAVCSRVPKVGQAVGEGCRRSSGHHVLMCWKKKRKKIGSECGKALTQNGSEINWPSPLSKEMRNPYQRCRETMNFHFPSSTCLCFRGWGSSSWLVWQVFSCAQQVPGLLKSYFFKIPDLVYRTTAAPVAVAVQKVSFWCVIWHMIVYHTGHVLCALLWNIGLDLISLDCFK